MYSNAESSFSGGTSQAQRAPGKAGREQRLTDASNRPRLEHRDDSLDNRFDRHSGSSRNLTERIDLKTGEAILRNREDRRIYRIGYRGGKRSFPRGGFGEVHVSSVSTAKPLDARRRRGSILEGGL